MAAVRECDFQNDVNTRLLAMARRTGYSFMQTNGQRKYGPPPHWKGPPPPKGSEVFVGRLPRDIYEDELVPIFEKVGTIYEVRLMMDFSGSNRGFAFIQFTNPREADRAVRELDNYEVRPRRYIGVVKSVDNCRLFVGGLPKNRSKQDIADELSKHVEGITDVILYSSVVDKTKNRGFAFVEFQNHRSAAMARRKLIPGHLQLWDYEIQIDWAIPEQDVDEETMSKVKILYIRNLMLSTTEQTIWKAMESVRGPECLERVKKLRDFAFVHFSDRESAKAAMEHWNKKELDGSVVEVTWARPAHRGTERQLKRGGYPGIQYVLPPEMGSAASCNPGLPNVRNGRGTYGSSHAQSSSRWKGGRTFIMVPPHIIRPRALEVLSEYCHKNNWGEPYFSIMPVISNQEEKVYMCRVVIPQYPGDQSQFQTPRISLSAEEAKILAAEITLFRLRSAGHTAASSEGYSHTSIGPAEHVRPQPSTASYSAHNGLHTHPDIAITYALRPSQAPGYLVHGEVGGYDTQFYDSQYQVLM